MTTTNVLCDSDFVRGARPQLGGGALHKEWHHFVVHDGGFRLILNFSLAAGPDRTAHRVIALARHDGWRGTIEEFEPKACVVRSGRVALRFGSCEFALVDDAYDLAVTLPTIGLRARLRLVPVSMPFVVNNQPLATGARLSWLFVPRLEAHGHVWIGDTRVGVNGAPAYHDHNWGHFRWGDDFGWEWGSVLPARGSDPWTIVCMRMTDRNRRRATRQALYAWYGREPVALWRDAAMTVEHHGFLRRPPALTMPGVMRMLRAGSASDVPSEITIVGHGDDRLALRFEPDEYVRIVVPNEVDPLAVVVLNEVSGRITATGRVGGRSMDLEAAGVFELLH